jgi:hypothetical protein
VRRLAAGNVEGCGSATEPQVAVMLFCGRRRGAQGVRAAVGPELRVCVPAAYGLLRQAEPKKESFICRPYNERGR